MKKPQTRDIATQTSNKDETDKSPLPKKILNINWSKITLASNKPKEEPKQKTSTFSRRNKSVDLSNYENGSESRDENRKDVIID